MDTGEIYIRARFSSPFEYSLLEKKLSHTRMMTLLTAMGQTID